MHEYHTGLQHVHDTASHALGTLTGPLGLSGRSISPMLTSVATASSALGITPACTCVTEACVCPPACGPGTSREAAGRLVQQGRGSMVQVQAGAGAGRGRCTHR